MKTFTCDECNRVFEEEPGDNEAARAEAEENFPGMDPDTEMGLVCDDCFHRLMKAKGHFEYAGSKNE